MRPVPLALAAIAVVTALAVRRSLGKGAVAMLLGAAAGLAVLGSGVVELPGLEPTVERVGTTLGGWTYLLVGGLAFLESAAFVGLVAPGELAVVLGGIVAGRGDVDLVLLIAVVWVSAVGGDLAGYAFGRRVGRQWALRHGRRVGLTDARLSRAERYFAAHGGKTIVVGRFVGLIRALTPFIAGASRMRLRRFLLADVVGAGLWAATFCILGYLFWRSLDRALELARTGKLGLLVFVGALAVGLAVYRLARHPEDRRRLAAWVRELGPSR